MSKVVVITGGSRGIGAATARLAGANGYAVCVNYRQDREAADTVVRAIEAGGSQAVAAQADVSVESDVMRLFETADWLGTLRGLVNNAGNLHGAARQRWRAESGRSREGARANEARRTTKEVAYAILWLLSDEASFTTGAFIDVTGGK
jgi:NAD(P)-dependent dehydrogenase (short-subunit alcohol dehydrogenase family)